MPGFNQKGPLGQGPMTGRRMGRCANFGAAVRSQELPPDQDQKTESSDNFPGCGFGQGRRMGGRGRGMGRMNHMRGKF
jgi:hypothetical protein